MMVDVVDGIAGVQVKRFSNKAFVKAKADLKKGIKPSILDKQAFLKVMKQTGMGRGAKHVFAPMTEKPKCKPGDSSSIAGATESNFTFFQKSIRKGCRATFFLAPCR